MDNRYKHPIGEEVSPIVPDAIQDDHAVNLGQVKLRAKNADISGAGTDKADALDIIRPLGGKTRHFYTNAQGAIQIKFPITTQSAVFSMQVHLFGRFYGDNPTDAATIHIVGESNSMYENNFSATITCQDTRLDLPIRFGNDGTNYCVWIAETNYIFDYVGVGISNFYVGRLNSGTFEDWKGAFDISRVTAFGTVDVLLEDNLPASMKAKVLTGIQLDLSNLAGNNYNYAAPSAALEYTIEEDSQGNKKIVVNGHAPCAVNAPSEPKVKLSSGTAEVASLVITAGTTSGGDVIVTLDGVSTNVTLALADSDVQAADKIRAATYSGWTTGGTVGTTTVTFTCDTVGVKTDATYNPNGTGATGDMTTTTQGVDNTYATKLSSTSDFVANTDMELIVESKDGTNVRYFFLNASAV